MLITSISLILKDTTRSASYLDLCLEIDTEVRRLSTKLNNKRDDFNFPIVNFPFLCTCSNTPAAPAYVVYISRNSDFLDTCLLLNKKATKERVSSG